MSHFMMNRRRFISNVATVGGLAAAQTLIGVRAGLAQDVAQVKMQLGWLAPTACSARWWREEGFLRRGGVEFEITPGGPNVDGVAGVAAGQSKSAKSRPARR